MLFVMIWLRELHLASATTLDGFGWKILFPLALLTYRYSGRAGFGRRQIMLPTLRGLYTTLKSMFENR